MDVMYSKYRRSKGGFQGVPNARGRNIISPFHLSELVPFSLDMQVGQHVETAICPRALPSDMHTVTLHRSRRKCILLSGYY